MPSRVPREEVGHALQREHRVDLTQLHAARHAHGDGRVVDHRVHPVRDEHVDHLLRDLARHRHDPDVDRLIPQRLPELPHVLDDQRPLATADQAGGGVERLDDVEALRREAAVAQDRLPQPARPHQRHLPLAVQAQDAAQRVQQVAHVVAPPLLAEAPEVRQVLANLGGRHAQLAAQLPRTDHGAALHVEQGQGAHVDRQPVDDDFGDFVDRHSARPRADPSGSGGSGAATATPPRLARPCMTCQCIGCRGSYKRGPSRPAQPIE